MVVPDPAGTADDLVVPGVLPPLSPIAGEVVAREAQSTTVANADGTLSTTYSIRPQAWRDERGAWRDFDNALVALPEPIDGFGFANRSGPFVARFASAATVAPGGPMWQLVAGEMAITTSAEGVRPSRTILGERSLTYAQAWPGVDLRYTLDNERIKEEIVLDAALVAAPTFAFSIDLAGLRAEPAPGGGIAFRDAAGEARFIMPPLTMSDSAALPAVARVSFELASRPGGVLLTVTPALAWLSDPARVYPVSIDPSVGYVEVRPEDDRANNVGIDEATPSSNYYGAATMSVGKASGGSRTDALMSFPTLASFPADSVVIDAELELEMPSGTNGMAIELFRVEAAWEDSTVTWGTAPPFDPQVVATASAVIGGDTNFEITELVIGWLTGALPNHGLRLRSAGGNGQSVAVHSSWATCQCQPELEITYAPATRYGFNSLSTHTSSEYGGGNAAAVEISSGNLAFTHAGGSIDARGFSVDLTHTYNSADPIGQATGGGTGVYGEGWTFAWNLRLFEVDATDGVIFKDGSGDQSRVFVDAGTGGGVRTYSAPPHYGLTLIEDVSSPPPDKVWTLTSDVGNVKHFFDAGGKLTRIEDRNANFLTFGYDASDRLTTITDVASRTATLEYLGVGGRLSKITDTASRVSTYGYNAAGDLTTIKHGVGSANEVTTTLGYDDAHRLISVTNPRGHTANIAYSAFNRWETAGNVEDWEIDDGDPTLAQSTARAHSGTGSLQVGLTGVGDTYEAVQKDLDTPAALSAIAHELLVWVFLPSGSTGLRAQLGLEYADHVEVNAPWQDLTVNAWTAVRMPAAQIEALGQVDEVELHFKRISGQPEFTGSVWVDDLALRGQVASQTDAKPTPNTVVTYAYQPDMRETIVSRPNSGGSFQPTDYVYDRLGAVTSVTDPLGNQTAYARDDLLRITSITPPGAGAVPYQLAYYPNSVQLQTATNPAAEVSRRGANTVTGDTRYLIDPLNEALRAGGSSPYDATIFSRDPATGNVLAAVSNRYAAGADLESDPFPAAQSVHRRLDFSYTTGGLLDTMTDPLGRVTDFGYDVPKGYLTSVQTPAGAGEGSPRTTTIVRNADGSVASITDAKGQLTTFEYDGLGRLKKVNYGVGGGGAFSVTYTLDANGNLTAMSDKAGSSTFTYDQNNRLTAQSRTQNATTNSAAYAYFANGTLQTLTTFANQTVTFGYDNALRLTSQTDPKNGGAAITLGYDARSCRTTITYPSGVKHTQSYDAGDRVKEILLEQANGTDLQSFTYDYGFDGNGNRTAAYRFGFAVGVSELGGAAVSYTYDELARLTGAVRTGTGAFTQSFGYDDANNRTSFTNGGSTTTYTYDAANQLTSGGGVSYTYDRNGNLTAFTGGNTLSYDASNHWTSGAVSGTALTYTYDGFGRQVSRKQGSNRTDFWFDATGMTLETGQSSLTYLRDPSGLPLSVTSSGTVRNFGRDRLGSITGLTNTSQVLQRTYTYDPYGTIVAQTGTQPNNLKFTAGRQDPSTSWYTLGQRVYRPDLARFTQLDPLPSSITDLNRYAYASCNPANFIDPTGLITCQQAAFAAFGLLTASDTLTFLALALMMTGVGLPLAVGLELIAFGGIVWAGYLLFANCA